MTFDALVAQSGEGLYIGEQAPGGASGVPSRLVCSNPPHSTYPVCRYPVKWAGSNCYEYNVEKCVRGGDISGTVSNVVMRGTVSLNVSGEVIRVPVRARLPHPISLGWDVTYREETR